MKAYIIMDGQWGSCGKGLIAGKLAMDRKPDVIVCNFGPNAGHTFIHDDLNDGYPIMTQQLPSGMVHKGAVLVLGPGAIIDPSILADEIRKFDPEFNISKRLFIHPRAAVVTMRDKIEEGRIMGTIGSTKKGTGAAVARKIMRVEGIIARGCTDLNRFIIDEDRYNRMMAQAKIVQIESAQGLELSLNHGSSYPHCTSRDVTPEAILNDVGIPRRFLDEVIVAIRPYPIRVGHEYDENGRKIGDSGPVYPDQEELTWDYISSRLPFEIEIEERTTVTNKVRRVFTWSWEQFEHMQYMLGDCKIFLNFTNYQSITETHSLMQGIWERDGNIAWTGIGPNYEDVEDVEGV